jgi:hypothetical protein
MRSLRAPERSTQIDIDHSVPVIIIEIHVGLSVSHTSIVYHYI